MESGTEPTFEIGDGTVDLQRGLVQRADRSYRLTTMERELLSYLVARANQVVPREVLLRDVWQYAPTVSSRAPDSAVSRLRRKIEVDPDAPRHLLTAHGGGYLWVGTGDVPTDPPAPDRGEPELQTYDPPIPIAGGSIDLARLRVVREDTVIDLTANEVALLRTLRSLRGQAADRRQLGRAVGREASGRWLDNAIARLRQKIEADPANPRHLLTARGQGVRLEPLGIDGEIVAVAVLAIPAAARLWADAPDAMPDALLLLRECTETALAHHGGVSLDTGRQARRMAFEHSGAAVRFAVELQLRLARQPWPSALSRSPDAAPVLGIDGRALLCGPRVSIAVHRGERDVGLMVAEAVVAGAHGGEIWVSSAAWEDLDAPDPSWEVEVLAAGAGAGAIRSVRPQGFSAAFGSGVGPPVFGAPTYAGAFLGRERELAAIAAAVARPGAVVTLRGLGGMGKTRLAARAASALRPTRPGGVWWADLSEARDEGALLDVLAAQLRIAGPRGSSKRIADALAARPGALVVLDNAEPIAGIVAERIAEWCGGAPEVAFAVTSRVALGLQHELVIEVGPLDRTDGIELFVERAREHLGVDALDDQDATIAAIVDRLDAIPLAIELAAARLDLSPLGAILAELTALADRDDALTRALDWSWARLDKGDRSVLEAAAVFVGGGTIANLAATVGLPAAEVEHRIGRLRSAGWLRIVHPSPSASRFAVYEVVRAFLRGKAGPEQVHALSLAHALAHARSATRTDPTAERLDLENLFAAAEFALEEPLPDVLGAAATRAVAIARSGGRGRAALALAERAVAFHAVDPNDRARLLCSCATLQYDVGEMRGALEAAVESIAIASERRDHHVHYQAAMMACNAAAELRDHARFAGFAGQAVAVADALGDPILALEARIYLAGAHHESFGGERALQLAFELVARLRPQGPSTRLARTLNLAGGMSMDLGRPTEALPLLREALEVYRALDATAAAVALQVNLGGVLGRLDPASGRSELESGLELARSHGMEGLEFICQVELARVAEVQGRQSEALARLDAAARLARAPVRSVYVAAHRSAALLHLGRTTEAATQAELAARDAEAIGDWEIAALSWAIAARARAANAPELARSHLSASVRALEHAPGAVEDVQREQQRARRALEAPPA